jgi:hypothetical protein
MRQPAEHSESSLDIGRRAGGALTFGSRSISLGRLLGYLLPCLWGALFPTFLSYKGAQHLHHGRVVPLGILGDALQGVDPAQRDAELALVVAQLLDCLGVPVGDLPFPGQLLTALLVPTILLKLPPGDRGTDSSASQRQQADQALDEGGSDLVFAAGVAPAVAAGAGRE